MSQNKQLFNNASNQSEAFKHNGTQLFSFALKSS
jgi:hypothetical protein